MKELFFDSDGNLTKDGKLLLFKCSFALFIGLLSFHFRYFKKTLIFIKKCLTFYK